MQFVPFFLLLYDSLLITFAVNKIVLFKYMLLILWLNLVRKLSVYRVSNISNSVTVDSVANNVKL